jgi:hypothetical protein
VTRVWTGGDPRTQTAMFALDIRQMLPADHPALYFIEMVGKLDLSGFKAAYRADGRGRPTGSTPPTPPAPSCPASTTGTTNATTCRPWRLQGVAPNIAAAIRLSRLWWNRELDVRQWAPARRRGIRGDGD